MTAKQSVGNYAPDGSKYATLTDGAGTLVTPPAKVTADANSKGILRAQATDGSIYLTLTNGSGTLI